MAIGGQPLTRPVKLIWLGCLIAVSFFYFLSYGNGRNIPAPMVGEHSADGVNVAVARLSEDSSDSSLRKVSPEVLQLQVEPSNLRAMANKQGVLAPSLSDFRQIPVPSSTVPLSTPIAPSLGDFAQLETLSSAAPLGRPLAPSLSDLDPSETSLMPAGHSDYSTLKPNSPDDAYAMREAIFKSYQIADQVDSSTLSPRSPDDYVQRSN